MKDVTLTVTPEHKPVFAGVNGRLAQFLFGRNGLFSGDFMTALQLSTLHIIASKKAPEISAEADDGLVQQSIDYLASNKALKVIDSGAYCTKMG